MKPAPFQYYAPETLASALEMMDQHGSDARVLAGGQSLIPALNFRCLTPRFLVDLNNLPELDRVHIGHDGELVIGAMARYLTLEKDPLVKHASPMINDAIPYIAHTAIRTRGTIGGSLAYADPASELPAVTLALNARYRAVKLGTERWIPAEDFYLDSFTTLLDPQEILVEVAIPKLAIRSGWAFRELARRQGDRAMLGVAAMVTLDESGICRQAKIACMNAARTPLLAFSAADLLIGQKQNNEIIQTAARQLAMVDIDPPDDAHASCTFRRHLAEELAGQVLLQAFNRAVIQ